MEEGPFNPPVDPRGMMASEFGSNMRRGFGGSFFGRGWGGGGPPGFLGLFRRVFRHKKVVAGIALVVVGVKVVQYFKMKKLREKWNAAGKDVVVLHTLPRGYTCPCLTPFSVKLETFFRMMDIKYELDYEKPMGPKNKVPWITLNGQDYSDSELIVQDLQQKFNKFPDAGISEELRAIGTSMQIMLEEHFYWGIVSWRYIEDDLKGVFQVAPIPPYFRLMMKTMWKKLLTKMLYAQGAGRHSIADLHRIMKKDLKALSVFLGDKPFLLGKEPAVVDCAIFACISQIVYNSPGSPYLRWIKEDFPNLLSYNNRMKDRFWPDWNQIILKPELSL